MLVVMIVIDLYMFVVMCGVKYDFVVVYDVKLIGDYKDVMIDYWIGMIIGVNGKLMCIDDLVE